MARFNAAQPMVLHEKLRRILQAVLDQCALCFRRNISIPAQQWHNRETTRMPSVLRRSLFASLAEAMTLDLWAVRFRVCAVHIPSLLSLNCRRSARR
jgi:hypothetical protein